jgi:hypothetical protein
MKAFLSHSSKDKAFIRKVAEELGLTQIEYDEKTLEYTLNMAAIRRALTRCSVFVAFVSRNSISSNFVNEELRSALEARGRGDLRGIMVISIDGTSHPALPEWMREINITHQISSPKMCARKIQAALIASDSESAKISSYYLGREEDQKQLLRAVAKPPKQVPISLHIVGHYGIGRRTFLQKSLASAYPRLFSVFPEVTMGPYDGTEELFRSIYDLSVASTLSEKIAAFNAFELKSPMEQIGVISEMIADMIDAGEFLTIVDDGGALTEDGDLQPHIVNLIKQLESINRPTIAIIQYRNLPLSKQQNHSRTHHIYLRPLDDDTIIELLSLMLTSRNIDYTESQIREISEHIDGHPFNVKFAVEFIETLKLGLEIEIFLAH